MRPLAGKITLGLAWALIQSHQKGTDWRQVMKKVVDDWIEQGLTPRHDLAAR